MTSFQQFSWGSGAAPLGIPGGPPPQTAPRQVYVSSSTGNNANVIGYTRGLELMVREVGDALSAVIDQLNETASSSVNSEKEQLVNDVVDDTLSDSPELVSPVISGAPVYRGSSASEPIGQELSDFFSKVGLTDGDPVDFFVVTVANTTCGATIFLTAGGSLGDGDSAAAAYYAVSVSRVAGAATKAVVSSAAGTSRTVGGVANCEIAVTVTAPDGANDAEQTFIIQGAVDVSSGSSGGGHRLALKASLFDLKLGSVSIST